MNRYSYNGPVMMGDKYIGLFKGETVACSESSARRTLIFQCKKKCNIDQKVNIKLAGKITKI
jgi:hypothetical protein